MQFLIDLILGIAVVLQGMRLQRLITRIERLEAHMLWQREQGGHGAQ